MMANFLRVWRKIHSSQRLVLDCKNFCTWYSSIVVRVGQSIFTKNTTITSICSAYTGSWIYTRMIICWIRIIWTMSTCIPFCVVMIALLAMFTTCRIWPHIERYLVWGICCGFLVCRMPMWQYRDICKCGWVCWYQSRHLEGYVYRSLCLAVGCMCWHHPAENLIVVG